MTASKALEERIKSHSDAFQGLLSLLPTEKRVHKEKKKFKKGKKDSDVSKKSENKDESAEKIESDKEEETTPLEELDETKTGPVLGKKAKKLLKKQQRQAKLRAKLGQPGEDEEKEGSKEEENDEDETNEGDSIQPAKKTIEEESAEVNVIFDDEGNAIGTINVSDNEEEPEIDNQPTDTNDQESKSTARKVPEKQSKKEQQSPKKKLVESKTTTSNKTTQESASKQQEESKDTTSIITNTSTTKHKANPEKLEELRSKLESRIKEFKEKRHAPGTITNGTVRTREAILSARRQKEEKEKQLKRKRLEEDDEEEEEEEEEEDDEENDVDDSKLMFSSVEFADGSKPTADLKEMRHAKSKKGPRDILGQLKHIQARNAKIAKMGTDKKAEMETKNMWSKAIAQSEGVKIKDDVKKLKTSLKKHTNKKLKTERDWNQRKETVQRDKEKRIEKRNEHIALKMERSKLHGKKAKKRAGFEGGIAKARVRALKKNNGSKK